ncbi:MAG: hypothetical protein P8Z30_18945, partial [Acidobacteriota bacterium]
VLLPVENEPNVKEDLPGDMLEGVELRYVKTIQNVIDLALQKSNAPAEVRASAPMSGKKRTTKVAVSSAPKESL